LEQLAELADIRDSQGQRPPLSHVHRFRHTRGTSLINAGVPVHVAPIAAGALIVGVVCDSAAQSAGMVPGDVITSVNGQPVTTPASLTTITGKYHPGDVVSVLWVSRDGIEHTTKMRLGEGPAR